MKLIRMLAVAVILAAQFGLSSARAENEDEKVDVKALLKRIEELEQKVRILESNKEPVVATPDAKAPKRIEELDQQVRILQRKRELDAEAADARFKEASQKSTSLFKSPDWVTSVRLVNDLRMRYDGSYAPDSDFVTRQRIRPRLRLGAIATLKDDWEIGRASCRERV